MAYRRRTLIIADHWDGSVQQFYHFLLGYYLPLCGWLREHPGTPIAVRDCGPMNPWFDLLSEHRDVEIIQPGMALHAIVGDRMAHRILKGLDDPRRFGAPGITRARDALLQILRLPESAADRERIVIVDRATSEDFYHSGESETHMSGAERRSVPNLRDIGTELGPDSRISLVDLARIPPVEQVRLMQGARVLVGQHGAGLVHMIWMRPGSVIVEIAPPLPPEVVDLFELLARCLGHDYVRIPQETVHAPVDLSAVARAITVRT
jgi:hypothetical protein